MVAPASPSAEPLLAFSAVTKSFGPVRALDGVDFDLRAGEVHALLGENGAGKSTLIRIATGAHAPDGGVIRINGRPQAALSPAAARALGIACIYQQPALFPDLTVAENLALRLESAGTWRRIDWRQRHTRAAELMQRVGARIAPDTEVRDLSMPEQQLVEIAAALGAGARIVIMDEPTAALTQREQERLFILVRALRAEGTGIVYISHRLDEIFALADRVTVLRDGASVGTRTVRDVDEATLIHLMVGRTLGPLYPPRGTSTGAPALELRGVGCAATGVRDVSLTVHAGEILGLAGLVGAGRTELARILFGLTPADAGEIVCQGRPVRIESPPAALAEGIAYVPEDRRRHGVVPELPVAQNLTLAAHRRIFPQGWLRAVAERAIAEAGIAQLGIKTDGPDAAVATLSGGNQQKVAVGRWLETRPRVLILDEPTQGVDIGAKVELHRLIRDLANGGLAVILISSDLPEVIGLSDRIAVMRGGTVRAVLPGGTAAPVVMAAALGADGGGAAA
ncbi:MAG: sugar ABC transporter ATP-binding protein [Opitutaceae bacterium]|nr:sugar ABC transporter ATP-binding protein [Opitutaceae bacterium]